MTRSEELRQLTAEIAKALDSPTDAAAVAILNPTASADPAVFFAAAIRALAAHRTNEGSRHLVVSLAKDRRLAIGLLDPKVCSVEEAVAVTRAAAEAGVKLQPSFEVALNKALQGQASEQKRERILRLLDVLSVNSNQSCWNSFQVELMAYPDKVVRSKAALLIGKATHNVQWIARRLLDRDPRVQASAVEALWGLDAEEVRPHFVAALKSASSRVAANAALGLYLCGDVAGTRGMLEMLRNPDPGFQLSGLWAMGETRDERFLAFLTDHYKRSEGKVRLAAVGAMSRIRRARGAAQEGSQLHVHVSHAAMLADGLRRLAFAISCHPARDLRGMKATEVAVWENGALIEDYQLRAANAPAVWIAGFVAPWFGSGDEPYEKHVREALRQCLVMKRRDDLWRIDRYSIEINPPAPEKGALESSLPYEDAVLTPEVKASFGCIADHDLVEKVLHSVAPRERAAPDPIKAMERLCDALAKRGGKRHVFLFLHDSSGAELKEEAGIGRLRTLVQERSVVLHGVCPDVAGQWKLFKDLCLANPEGSYTESTLEGMVDGMVDAYAKLCSQFELDYSLPANREPGAVILKISSDAGHGETSLQIAVEPAPSPTPAETASPPAPATETVKPEATTLA